MAKLACISRWDEETASVLRDGLVRVPNRTYLWLHLVLNVENHSEAVTPKRMTKLVNELAHTFEDAYKSILGNLNSLRVLEQ